MPELDENDDYDHDYEAFYLCANCEELHENCQCESFQPEDQNECDICGMSEDDPVHG